MKKRWKSAATGTFAALALAGVVSGCGTANGTSSSGNSTKAASVPKGQTITLWVWEGGPNLKDVTALANAWAKKHGDTVKIVDQHKNPNGFKFYATAARTGKGPDVLYGMPHDNNGLFAQEGLLSPVPKADFDPSKYNASVVHAVTVNGKIYSIPMEVETTAIFYNKKMIKTPPKNWTEFVKDANAHGFMYDQANLYDDYALIGGFGGYVFKSNNGTLDPKDIGLNNAGAVQAFTLMRQMDSKYHWMNPSVTGAVAKSKFIAGKIGMYVSGPWDIPDVKKAGVNFGIAPWPTLPNGKPATPFMGVKTTIVNAKSKHQAADWSLAKALTNKAAQQKLFNDAQQIPALKSLQNSSVVQQSPMFKAFADQTKVAVPMPNIPQMQAAWSAMSVIKNIVNGKVSPQTGANDFVKNIKKGIQVQGS
ncbi:maltose ABC transporter substrate-binding protein [Alicyclobacillus sp. SO9]|uniref:sugar ABC transporter substrate-binding protein n=1 Tax=Alicyclobacillus sp. SO9 TaxID=2665646 RepID=UPI0018E8F049|nr:maltose ABC transporter substrate-binding protein [Alicyclobacillus sp. SO9]QQE78643.1 maltose ABC transporter substrate-binding protein [Alicyclobacillus sp. SO9]